MSQAQEEIAVKVPAVEAETKLVQISLKMLTTQTMVSAVHSSLCVPNDGMKPL